MRQKKWDPFSDPFVLIILYGRVCFLKLLGLVNVVMSVSFYTTPMTLWPCFISSTPSFRIYMIFLFMFHSFFSLSFFLLYLIDQRGRGCLSRSWKSSNWLFLWQEKVKCLQRIYLGNTKKVQTDLIWSIPVSNWDFLSQQVTHFYLQTKTSFKEDIDSAMRREKEFMNLKLTWSSGM